MGDIRGHFHPSAVRAHARARAIYGRVKTSPNLPHVPLAEGLPMTKKPLLRGFLSWGDWSKHPTKPGWEYRYATLSVWCPYCCRFHQHGWDPKDNGRVVGHRVAHCMTETPFDTGGYYISPFRKGD